MDTNAAARKKETDKWKVNMVDSKRLVQEA